MGTVQSTNFLGIFEQMRMMKDTKQIIRVAETLPIRQSRQAMPSGSSIQQYLQYVFLESVELGHLYHPGQVQYDGYLGYLGGLYAYAGYGDGPELMGYDRYGQKYYGTGHEPVRATAVKSERYLVAQQYH